jgi:hypothetical protein
MDAENARLPISAVIGRSAVRLAQLSQQVAPSCCSDVASNPFRQPDPAAIPPAAAAAERDYEAILAAHYASMPHVAAAVRANSSPPGARAAHAADSAAPSSPMQTQPQRLQQPLQSNRVLASHHRVILGEWPIVSALDANDPRTASLEALFEHCATVGYEGMEIGPVCDVRQICNSPLVERLPCTGRTLHA